MSIITPTLNRAAFLEQTVRSVRNQSYQHFEHIIIDGGSTDGTLDVLRRLESTYPMRWLSEPDRGMYEAVNKGLRMARGSILAYLNSDDLYLPWALEVIVEHFGAHTDADFVFGGAIKVDDRTGRQAMYFQMPFDPDYIRRVGFLFQPAVFWRREVFEAEGAFDETLRYVADCDYWMRTARRRTYSHVKEFIAVERDHYGTAREGQEAPLMAELAVVRSRYVTMSGRRHRIALLRHRIRVALWIHSYWVLFALQSLMPRRWRGPWSRLINSGEPKIYWHLLPLRLIPGWKRRPRLIGPSRYWLEHPDETPT